MSFFQIFHKKPHPTMPIFGQKNVNFVKTTLYYGPKKSKGCPFFPIFHDKISTLMPIFCQKNVHSKHLPAVNLKFFITTPNLGGGGV